MFIGGFRTKHDGLHLGIGTLAGPITAAAFFETYLSQLSSCKWLGSMNPMRWRCSQRTRQGVYGLTLWLNDLALHGISTSESHRPASQTPCPSVADASQSAARGTESENGFLAFVRKKHPVGRERHTRKRQTALE